LLILLDNKDIGTGLLPKDHVSLNLVCRHYCFRQLQRPANI